MQNMQIVLKLINAYARFLPSKFTSDDPGDLIIGFALGDLRSSLVIIKVSFSSNLF